jgi:dolichol-phosphate mannosyltransferase
MDADLSHDPRYLPDLVAAAADHDIVLGSRYLNGVSVVNWPLRRIILSSFANAYVRTITGLTTRDSTSGYRCWRRAALERLDLARFLSHRYAFMVETVFEIARLGGRVGEVPIIFIERRQGASKMSGRVLLESMVMPWRLVIRNRGRVRRPGGGAP